MSHSLAQRRQCHLHQILIQVQGGNKDWACSRYEQQRPLTCRNADIMLCHWAGDFWHFKGLQCLIFRVQNNPSKHQNYSPGNTASNHRRLVFSVSLFMISFLLSLLFLPSLSFSFPCFLPIIFRACFTISTTDFIIICSSYSFRRRSTPTLSSLHYVHIITDQPASFSM